MSWDNNDRSVPTRIGSGTNWATVSAGDSHTVAVTADGTLWAWGSRANGRIGEGATSGSQLYPIQVGTDTNWAQASASATHTAAVRTNGTIWAWGANDFGQLGDGTTSQRAAPVQVGTLTTWASVSAGSSFTTGIREDGSAWAWGANSSGQLGDGTTAHSTVPVQVVP